MAAVEAVPAEVYIVIMTTYLLAVEDGNMIALLADNRVAKEVADLLLSKCLHLRRSNSPP